MNKIMDARSYGTDMRKKVLYLPVREGKTPVRSEGEPPWRRLVTDCRFRVSNILLFLSLIVKD